MIKKKKKEKRYRPRKDEERKKEKRFLDQPLLLRYSHSVSRFDLKSDPGHEGHNQKGLSIFGK